MSCTRKIQKKNKPSHRIINTATTNTITTTTTGQQTYLYNKQNKMMVSRTSHQQIYAILFVFMMLFTTSIDSYSNTVTNSNVTNWRHQQMISPSAVKYNTTTIKTDQINVESTNTLESTTMPIMSHQTTKQSIFLITLNGSDHQHPTINNIKNLTESKQKLSTSNELWDGLINECLDNPTFSCFQKNVYSYLDNTLGLRDINVTNSFKFLKNTVNPYKYTKEANTEPEINNNIPDGEDEARSASPLEEVTDAMSGKGVNFLMTHDVELHMPDMLFDGATFRISPRSFEGNGALVKLELIPKALKLKEDAGRILFKPIKKIKKFFRNKLLLSFFAIVLIIKLIKIKLLWVLPFLVGVGAAKKLVLKFVLFLFPALANIFKLCSWYHRNYHDTKYHHHQHSISHLHTVVPPWFNEPHVDHSLTGHSHHPEIIYTSPPKGHPSEYLHGGPPPHQHYAQDWESSGPGLGSEYISDRNAHVNSFRPKIDDSIEINSWGLGTTVLPPPPPTQSAPHRPAQQIQSHTVNVNPYVKKVSSRIINGPNVINNNPVYAPKRNQLSPQLAAQYTTVTDPKLLREAQKLQAKQQEALRIQAEQKLIEQQQKILQQQPFIQSQEDMHAIIDPFYSPILSKIDKIFLQLGFVDEPCRERLLCSMYKNPAKYSPHSNFISAELSRDTSELHRPQTTNSAVIRFYRYVQAARDGQDQRDCPRIYDHCTVNTER